MFRRGRRLRTNPVIRELVRENSLSPSDFIYPVFIVEGENIKREISSLKGNYHWSVDRLNELVDELKIAKVKSVILFGIPDHKDCVGSEAYNEDGIVQRAIRKLKELDEDLYEQVQNIFENHIKIRHIHGGESTKKKYMSKLKKL